MAHLKALEATDVVRYGQLQLEFLEKLRVHNKVVEDLIHSVMPAGGAGETVGDDLRVLMHLEQELLTGVALDGTIRRRATIDESVRHALQSPALSCVISLVGPPGRTSFVSLSRRGRVAPPLTRANRSEAKARLLVLWHISRPELTRETVMGLRGRVALEREHRLAMLNLASLGIPDAFDDRGAPRSWCLEAGQNVRMRNAHHVTIHVDLPWYTPKVVHLAALAASALLHEDVAPIVRPLVVSDASRHPDRVLPLGTVTGAEEPAVAGRESGLEVAGRAGRLASTPGPIAPAPSDTDDTESDAESGSPVPSFDVHRHNRVRLPEEAVALLNSLADRDVPPLDRRQNPTRPVLVDPAPESAPSQGERFFADVRAPTFRGGRIVVFVVGGVTVSEVRARIRRSLLSVRARLISRPPSSLCALRADSGRGGPR